MRKEPTKEISRWCVHFICKFTFENGNHQWHLKNNRCRRTKTDII